MTAVDFGNDNLKSVCEDGVWKDSYNDLLDCGENFIVGGTGGFNSRVGMQWGFVVADGSLVYRSRGIIAGNDIIETIGKRVVLELKSNVQISSVDGTDGTSSDKAYKLFLAD